MVDSTQWMPKGLSGGEKAEHAEAYPDDPHAAAAAAWESWAATLAAREASSGTAPTAAAVASVSTGAQSVTYDQPRTPAARAREQAAWHRARSHAESVPVGPQFYGVSEGTYLSDIGSVPGVTTGNDESNDALWNLGAP